MSGFAIGMNLKKVWTEAQRQQGKGMEPGKTATDGDGRTFIVVKVGASQNLTNGMAVVYNTSTFLTVQGTAAAAGVPNLGPVAIVYASVTASLSQMCWAQIFGLCNIAIMAASGSALPGAALKFAADGTLTAVGVTTASAYIDGMTCAATNSVISSPVASVYLNWPRAIGG